MLYNLNLLMSCIQPLWNMSPCNKIYFIYPGSKFLHTAEPVLKIVPVAVSALPGVSGVGLLIKGGEIVKKVPEDQLLDTLREELMNWDSNKTQK